MKFEDNVPTAPFISLMYREHAKFINENVKDEDLSFGLHPILIKAYLNDGISQEELAEGLHLNESTITPHHACRGASEAAQQYSCLQQSGF